MTGPATDTSVALACGTSTFSFSSRRFQAPNNPPLMPASVPLGVPRSFVRSLLRSSLSDPLEEC